jgi:hypothetical protein
VSSSAVASAEPGASAAGVAPTRSAAMSCMAASRRTLGFPTLNMRFKHWKPAASGIFAVLVHGLVDRRPGVANLACALAGTNASTPAGCTGDALPRMASRTRRQGAYGKIVRVELLHKLHDECATPASRPSARASRGWRRLTCVLRFHPPPDHARPNLERNLASRRVRQGLLAPLRCSALQAARFLEPPCPTPNRGATDYRATQLPTP